MIILNMIMIELQLVILVPPSLSQDHPLLLLKGAYSRKGQVANAKIEASDRVDKPSGGERPVAGAVKMIIHVVLVKTALGYLEPEVEADDVGP